MFQVGVPNSAPDFEFQRLRLPLSIQDGPLGAEQSSNSDEVSERAGTAVKKLRL